MKLFLTVFAAAALCCGAIVAHRHPVAAKVQMHNRRLTLPEIPKEEEAKKGSTADEMKFGADSEEEKEDEEEDEDKEEETEDAGVQTKVKFGTFGFDESGQDTSVKAGDDFFQFANGKYIENLKMPADQSSWGAFDILNDQALERVKGILEKDSEADGKMGNFYESFMDEGLVEILDAGPTKETLLQILAVTTAEEYAALSATAVNTFLPSPFSLSITPDAKDVKNYCVQIDQGGLGMPQDYYLKKSFAKKKAAYKLHIATILELGGASRDASKKASEDILALEDKIAKVHWTPAQQRDPIKNYNVMENGVEDLVKQAPGFDWATFIKGAGTDAHPLPGASKLTVGALGGVIGMAKILGETDIKTLQSYAGYHYLNSVSTLLSDRFVQAAFEFSKVMSGAKKLKPRWKRAVGNVNSNMGFEVGKEFVKQYFPASSKKKVEELTVELKAAFKDRITNVAWMGDETKKKALAKLASFDIQVGFPKKWRDYSCLHIDHSDLYGNNERSVACAWERELKRLGTTVDKDEWGMVPQTVNAYNQPMFNQIVFPAAILQPPFFDPMADDAVNYGAIGGVIGHEMTHGFDDQGRHYDSTGQMEDWWTEDDATKFKEKAKAYGEQFAKFDVHLGKDAHIKPELTMGEDIADLGGLNLGLQAYHASLAKKSDGGGPGAPAAHTDRVFLGWAQVWREKRRKAAALAALVSDGHPPAEARVDIPMRQIDGWYKAFKVEKGQKGFLDESERVKIW